MHKMFALSTCWSYIPALLIQIYTEYMQHALGHMNEKIRLQISLVDTACTAKKMCASLQAIMVNSRYETHTWTIHAAIKAFKALKTLKICSKSQSINAFFFWCCDFSSVCVCRNSTSFTSPFASLYAHACSKPSFSIQLFCVRAAMKF